MVESSDKADKKKVCAYQLLKRIVNNKLIYQGERADFEMTTRVFNEKIYDCRRLTKANEDLLKNILPMRYLDMAGSGGGGTNTHHADMVHAIMSKYCDHYILRIQSTHKRSLIENKARLVSTSDELTRLTQLYEYYSINPEKKRCNPPASYEKINFLLNVRAGEEKVNFSYINGHVAKGNDSGEIKKIEDVRERYLDLSLNPAYINAIYRDVDCYLYGPVDACLRTLEREGKLNSENLLALREFVNKQRELNANIEPSELITLLANECSDCFSAVDKSLLHKSNEFLKTSSFTLFNSR